MLSSLRRALKRREAVLESQCEGDTPVEAGFSGGRSSSALARTSALCSLYVLHRTLGRRYGLAVRYEGTSVDDIPVYGEVCTFLCTRGVKSCALWGRWVCKAEVRNLVGVDGLLEVPFRCNSSKSGREDGGSALSTSTGLMGSGCKCGLLHEGLQTQMLLRKEKGFLGAR